MCRFVFLHRSRQNPGKVRHKRQALQDMARPLKQWLYKHRDNPYPTKTEKILLALGSQMTLVQVSKFIFHNVSIHVLPRAIVLDRRIIKTTVLFYTEMKMQVLIPNTSFNQLSFTQVKVFFFLFNQYIYIKI